MCGLWGSFAETVLSRTEYDKTLTLATLSELRGMDSSGYVALFERDGGTTSMYTEKNTVTASQLLYGNPKIANIFNSADPFALFGHSRSATVGSVTKENAHPFRSKHILGMHNGTVSKLGNDEKTDSQEIFEILAEQGLEKTLAEIKYGAYCLVWLNVEDATLNIIKNKERPLVLSRSHAGTWFWSSEYAMLEFMKNRHGSTTAYNSNIIPVENELFQFDLLSRKLTRKDVKPYEAPKIFYRSVPGVPASTKSYFEKKLDEKKAESSRIEKADKELAESVAGLSKKQRRKLRQKLAAQRKAEERKAKPVVENTSTSKKFVYRGFRGTPMTAEHAQSLLAKGCCLYNEKGFTLEDKVYWITYDRFVSAKGVEDGYLQGYGIKEAHEGKYFPDGI